MALVTSGSTLPKDGGISSTETWAQRVEASSKHIHTKLDFFEPLMVNGKLFVAPPEEVRSEGSTYWENCLVGHFVGNRPAFPVVRSIAKTIWLQEGLQEVIAQDNGSIFFMFSTTAGMEAVLERGP